MFSRRWSWSLGEINSVIAYLVEWFLNLFANTSICYKRGLLNWPILIAFLSIQLFYCCVHQSRLAWCSLHCCVGHNSYTFARTLIVVNLLYLSQNLLRYWVTIRLNYILIHLSGDLIWFFKVFKAAVEFSYRKPFLV